MAARIRTLELLLEQEARLARGARHGKQRSSIGSGLGFWRWDWWYAAPGRSCFISGGVSSFGGRWDESRGRGEVAFRLEIYMNLERESSRSINDGNRGNLAVYISFDLSLALLIRNLLVI